MDEYENMYMIDEFNNNNIFGVNDNDFLDNYLDNSSSEVNYDINGSFNINIPNYTILKDNRNEDKSSKKKSKVKECNTKVISLKSKGILNENNISNSFNFDNFDKINKFVGYKEVNTEDKKVNKIYFPELNIKGTTSIKENKEKNLSQKEFSKMQNFNYINENNILSTNITSKVKSNRFIALKKKVHDKYYTDSIIKKVKSFIIKLLIIFVNEIIINERCKKDKTNNVLKRKYFRKIKKINPSIARNTKVKYNKKLLDTSIKDILTSNISEKYNQKIEYNKNLIESYCQKYKVAEKFFDKKFIDIFNYINDEDKKDKIFEGFEKIYENNLKSKKVDDKNIIIKNVKNFVKIINNRKSR